jgi:hypothetical protein
MLSERDQGIVLARMRGETLDTISRPLGITRERVRQIVVDATEHINRLELELLVARKEGVLLGLAIPNQEQQDRAIALDYLDWVLARLRERELDIKVTRRYTSEGLVVFLEDRTRYGKEN